MANDICVLWLILTKASKQKSAAIPSVFRGNPHYSMLGRANFFTCAVLGLLIPNCSKKDQHNTLI